MKACLLLFNVALLLAIVASVSADKLSFITVKRWAEKLGFELLQLGKYVTNVEKFRDSYQQADVVPIDGDLLVNEIAKELKTMMESKISAIKRIMDVAETSALSASDDDPPDLEYEFVNAKNCKNCSTEFPFSSHFRGAVNMSFSSVHVPTNVYERAEPVIRAIKWSEELDKTFINNFEHDPSLSWQYFGSATGFLRQYPAIGWEMETVDLYDCRTRSWYIEAASSPKDVVILMDTSGSMTGMRREIARHVANNILDTLGNNDFVNIITFTNETKEAVPCFTDILVQANLANVRELKNAISDIYTEKIANFSLALNRAFELLETYRTERFGARCNQAIMLITDGVPYNYKEIFETYNWQNNLDYPEKADMPVRVFTYLIGKEVADVREVKWMACANRGYYVHLSTLAEVREQVLNYVPVMARPLVLGRTIHPTVWTPVYADITDPKMSDWLWEQEQRMEQKERFLVYRKDKKFFRSEEIDKLFVKKRRRLNEQFHNLKNYRLMTSVSMPVFDRRDNANITEQVLVKEAYWVTQTRETRIANPLGVAGTDVPIEEILKLMEPHKLGVNGYAFIVTNNGFILIHPDLRPVFQGILKPSYNSVDMAEVELTDQNQGPREFEAVLLKFREEVINQINGTITLHTKYHYDDMKRVGRVKRQYHYKGIKDTPFTLVVSLPKYVHTGSYRVQAAEEIARNRANNKNLTNYFEGNNWRVHPDWTYCKYHFELDHKFTTPEKLLLHFLERMYQPRWHWSDKKQLSQPPEYSASGNPNGWNVTGAGYSSAHKNDKSSSPEHSDTSNPNGGGNVTGYGHHRNHSYSKPDRDSYYCDKNLFQNLVFDAMVTEWFSNPTTSRADNGPLARLMKLLSRKQFQERFGFTLAFVATHSGLTRWTDFSTSEESSSVPPSEHFSQLYPRAADEVWYKRAVEQHYIQAESFVYSVPIDIEGATEGTLVTASRAIFIDKGNGKAPAAVVGFQFQHSALQTLFKNITSVCDDQKNCHKRCGDESTACYIIDNHGYILAAEEEKDAGKFFGEVKGPVMTSLVEDGIFNKIKIYDYQAVCFHRTNKGNHAAQLLTPWKIMERTLGWMIGNFIWAFAKVGIYDTEWAEAFAYPEEEEEQEDSQEEHPEDYPESNEKPIVESKEEKMFDQTVLINRTRPEPCDQEINLYLLNSSINSKHYDVDMDLDVDSKGRCKRSYIVQPVSSSNMLLVIVDKSCPSTDFPIVTVQPEDISYENNSLACQKLTNNMSRRRPAVCIRSHKNESEIKDLCGLASSNRLHSLVMLFLPLMASLLVGVFANNNQN